MNQKSAIVRLFCCLLVLNLGCKTTSEFAISQEQVNAHSILDDYLTHREELLRQDSLLFASYAIPLSKNEQKLNEKIKSEQRSLIEKYKASHFFPPARNFYQSKEHIEQNELFRWIKKMPKGGALHLHTLAAGDPDWLIRKAMEVEEAYVYWSDDGSELKGKLKAFHPNNPNNTSRDSGYIPASEALSSPDAYAEMRELLTFDATIDLDSVDIWKEFEGVFGRINEFIRYDPIMPEYLAHCFEIMIQDNVQHVELRMPFEYNLTNSKGYDYGVQGLVKHLDYALSKARQIDPEFTAKVIHANLRFRGKIPIGDDMKMQLLYRQQYPDWLVGYDLVAEEDAGHNTLFHIEEFLALDSLGKTQKYHLPLYLHNGESNWMNTTNLYDSYLLGARRIGHGFNLFRFPALLRKVKERGTCIEINPLSNQILGYIRDLRLHPASQYMRNGINISISSDDPFIFDYHGLSYDFWSVFMAWELDLRDLKMLSLNGLKFSALEGKEKEKALKAWHERWNSFVTESLEIFELK